MYSYVLLLSVKIADGTGAGQTRYIAGNGLNQLTLTTPWATVPDASSKYLIGKPYVFDYGDYPGLAFHDDAFHALWSDNSNSTNDNPEGAYNTFDLYTARVTITD
jgi:hypothetical protein